MSSADPSKISGVTVFTVNGKVYREKVLVNYSEGVVSFWDDGETIIRVFPITQVLEINFHMEK